MKKRNFIFNLTLAAFCLGTIVSCSNKGIITDSEPDSLIKVNKPNLKKETEKEKESIITAVPYKYDVDTLKNLFFPDENITAVVKYDTDAEGKSYSTTSFQTKGAYLVSNDKWLTYDRNSSMTNYRLLLTDFTNESFFRKDLKTLFKQDSNFGLDRGQCQSMVETYLEGLNLGILKPSEVCYLDAQTLNKLEREIISDKDYDYNVRLQQEPRIRNWTKENEAFLFIYNFEIDGIPVTREKYTSTNGAEPLDGSFLYAIVSKDGVVTLESYGRYQKQSEKKVKVISYGRGLDNVFRQYISIDSVGPIYVNDAYLEYYPTYDKEQDVYILKPGMVFQLSTNKISDNIFNRRVVVDARSGEMVN